MAIQQNFPAITPALSLNFARSKILDPRITFTRTSTATREKEDGLIEVVPANQPRFDHEFVTSGTIRSLGLLVEEQRTNLFIYSDYSLDNSLNNVTLTQNAAIAPNGTNTAVSMDGSSTANNLKYSYKGFSTTTTGTYVTSVFLKYKNERFVVLRMNDNTGVNGVLQRIDILNGTFTQSVETGGTLTNATSTITPYPNGWYRVSVSGTFNNSLTQIQGAQVFLTSYGTTTTTNGVYLWGAQLEQGSFPTSYIPTTTSTVTRTADVVSITGSNFSSWYNNTEGTIYADLVSLSRNHALYPRLVTFLGPDVNNGNEATIYTRNISNADDYKFFGGFWDAVGNAADFNPPASAPIGSGRAALAIKRNNGGFAVNGSSVIEDTSGEVPSPIQARIFGQARFQPNSSGYIKTLTYYPKRLTNAQLQSLTR